MRYNSSTNFAARILVYNNTTELHSIEKQMASAGILDKTELQHTVKFAPLWVRNVTTVAFQRTSQRYVGKKQNNVKNTQKSKRKNNVENSKITDQSDNQNVNFFNYIEQYTSEYDSLDDSYVAMIYQLISAKIVPQNMNIIISNTLCHCYSIPAVDLQSLTVVFKIANDIWFN